MAGALKAATVLGLKERERPGRGEKERGELKGKEDGGRVVVLRRSERLEEGAGAVDCCNIRDAMAADEEEKGEDLGFRE